MNNLPTKNVILIVDDNPNNLSILFDYLIYCGFKAFVALDGETAIEQVTYTQPDLIFLDVMMPGIDGFETCIRLKSNPLTKDIPVIFMTALTDTVDKVKAFKSGAVDYITKPIQCKEVLSRIQTHLTIRHLQKQLQENNHELQKAQLKEQQKSLELEQSLRELQQTQLQLIQSEKMSSLGKMISGVAHEINNPVGFISGNLGYANQYIEQLLELLALYQETYVNSTPEIITKTESIELDFIKSDLLQIMNSIKVGAERLSQIVLLLRNFSRLDEAELKSVDIHEGINSTILLLQHRLEKTLTRPAIQIVKNYGNFSKIECYASQLNQVFLNLISNSIDAIESSESYIALLKTASEVDILSQITLNRQPIIQIYTELIDSVIMIRIIDNGLGMIEEVRRRLFEPFFTTKPVGSGRGLGLAICYQVIVEKHRGKIEVNSEPGKGTEFIIKLPTQC